MRIEKKAEPMNIALVLIFAGEYIAGNLSDKQVISECAVWCAVFFVVIYLFYNCCARMEELFLINSKMANMPVKRIIATNFTVTSVAALMILFGMLVFYNGPLGNIFTIIRDLLLNLLRWIIILIISLIGNGDDKTDIIEETTSETVGESQSFQPVMDENPGNLKDLYNAIAIILGIVIIVTAIYFLIRAFRKAFSYVGRIGSTDADIVEDIKVDKITKLEAVKYQKDTEVSETDLNLKARKLYKKQVRSVKKEKGTPSEAALARDITRMFEEGDRADEITRIYEKARYSNETVTRQEVETVKKST